MVREYSVPATFTVGEHDNIVSSVFSHEQHDPDHVIFQRLVNGAWTDVTCKEAAHQIRSAALGLIAEGVAPGDRVAVFSATDIIKQIDKESANFFKELNGKFCGSILNMIDLENVNVI